MNPYSSNDPAGGFETSTNAYKKQSSNKLVTNIGQAQNSTLRQSKSNASFDNEQAREAYDTIRASDLSKGSKNIAAVGEKAGSKSKSPKQKSRQNKRAPSN